MILTDLPAGIVLHRAHTPRWASLPASGAGAAIKGGRFNRQGIEALYLSLEELTALWHDWREDWRHLKFDVHIEPPTRVLSDIVRDNGYSGILFPSLVNEGGTNVVLFTDCLGDRNSIEVNDPDDQLPRDQTSWER